AVGITALGGLLQPLGDAEDAALLLTLGADGEAVNAPLAPGYYRPVGVSGWRRMPLGEPVELTGAGVLALDGERERVLKPGQRARLWVERTGPRVVDVDRVMQAAARDGRFRLPGPGDRRQTNGA